MPRLKLLRELLNDDGVIFISADDNEIFHLKMLMDEVFNNHYVGMLIWRKKEGGGQTDDYFVTEHEYILVYAKSEKFEWIDEIVPVNEAQFNKEDKDGKFDAIKLAKWGTGAKREDRPTMYFPIKSSNGKNIYPKTPDGRDGRWRVGKIRMEYLIENNLIYWEKKNDEWIPYEKVYFVEGSSKKLKERSILYEVANTGDASNELKDIFGVKDIFDNPKPVELIKFLISHSSDKNSIILDSFAGSGTTAHAVLELNKEENSNKRFILVQCDEYSKKSKKLEDICDNITAKRVRKVIKRFEGTFSYFELGDPIEMESILEGNKLPKYEDLARYVFYTATGEEFKPTKMNEKKNFIGETKEYEVYLFYKPDIEYLKSTAFRLDDANNLGAFKNKKRLVFAPAKYLDSEFLLEHRIEFCQLPFEIYRMKR